jgi:cephalosporin-C deacetylase-like acetyl esterase
MRGKLSSFGFIVLVLMHVQLSQVFAELQAADDVLPGTSKLTLKRPLDVVMVEGISRFCLRATRDSVMKRDKRWTRDFSSVLAFEESIAPNRKRLRAIIGAVDPRVTADQKHRHGFELLATLGQSSVVARTERVSVHKVRWQVLEGVTAEGLLLKPQRIRACVVAIPDADWTCERYCGLTDPDSVPANALAHSRLAQKLAESGCLVVIPTLISRSDQFSGHPEVGYTNLTHREFVYRQAFEMGRHIIGYEVQKVLAAVDLFQQLSPKHDWPIGVAGIGEGGLLALYAAAIDGRIDSTLVSGYFQQREEIWREPIYRNVWGLLTEFSDAEIASMVAPRRLVIEACRSVETTGPPRVRANRRNSAAPGRLTTASLASVRAEYNRVRPIYQKLKQIDRLILVTSKDDSTPTAQSARAQTSFALGLGIELLSDTKPNPWQEVVRLTKPDIDARQKRQLDELQTHVQTMLRLSSKTRDKNWARQEWSADTRDTLRRKVHDELIGRLPNKLVPPKPRSRLVLNTDHYAGYEILLDVFPDVIAGGILLLPHDLKPGEKRPVVVCQHGLERTAMDTISRDPRSFQSYKAFSDTLCRRGFIVYAPQNPYRGGDKFRSIQRQANPLKLSLFSFIIAQHQQTLNWLATLPNVDAKRIGFYGLSYGGKTAMRVPPFVDGYCLSICSGDFTDWARVITTNEYRYGYMFTGEYEIPEWNLGHIASYAELAMLIAPRPFMVEQGHRDGGTPSEWVASEYAKVRRHYDDEKIGNRTRIEFFNGPHTINGQGSFQFLHQHLNWPDR